MADVYLLTADQQQLVLAGVEALNRGSGDIHTMVRAVITPPPAYADIDTVVRIVQLDWVGYTLGETPVFILARLLDRIEETADGAG